jgi:acetyltransferase-like isoleucine patch superfamily enzyme
MSGPLQEEFSRLVGELRERTRERWDRDLPLGELIGDRWERARRLGFGNESSIYESAYVYGSVTVGARTWIGPFVLLDGTGGLSIGDGCDISAGVQVYTHDTVRRVLTNGVAEIDHAPVSIGSACHIGAQTVIAKGVTIGDHSVIGACSFVNRDIPPYAVAVGVPCRPIGRVEIDEKGSVSLVYGRGPVDGENG